MVCLDNDNDNYTYWRNAADDEQRAAEVCEQVKNGVWTVEEAAKFNLADRLKSDFEAEMPPVEGLWFDLLNSAVEEVDWEEIAEVILNRR